ncbi:hypothetical protein UlMin_043536 [Ulmus minor]
MDGEVIVVAVDASKEITDYALEWAIRNVARASDSLILLALLPSHSSSLANRNIRSHHSRPQFFSCLFKKLGIGRNKEGSCYDDAGLINGAEQDIFQRTNNVCEHMMQQLCSAHDLMEVHTEVKIVTDMKLGSVALKAEELQATWVILDRRLKRESDYCLKHLNCNIVLIDHSMPRILKAVNLPTGKDLKMGNRQNDQTENDMFCVPLESASEHNTATTPSSLLTGSSNPIFDTDVSLSLTSPDKGLFHKAKPTSTGNFSSYNDHYVNLNSEYLDEKVEAQETLSNSHLQSKFQPSFKASSFNTAKSPRKLLANPLYQEHKSYGNLLKAKNEMEEVNSTNTQNIVVPPRRSADYPRARRNVESLNTSKQLIPTRKSLSGNKSEAPLASTSSTVNRISSIRKAMSLYTKHPPNPPPLCSICKHSAPIFGKAPRKFSFKEIAKATDGFSNENFLAEGGYGAVYKGVLPDGQVVAVKQHKTLSAQGASEFCSEVEVLSCAQHRNLVMLVGYCIEIEWLLVYEFACNGSLDKHLYETEANELMSWKNRMKVAIGAARGLRYLHEDCRVGCIVHRDFRPNNILLTHDFEPMVGDFGLARWQADGQSAEETRVIGAFGYLAPEYTQSGLITEKADVYAFGVVLLELLSGFNVTNFSRKTGQQFVTEWGSPLLESMKINEIIDTRLENNYVKNEVECMMYAASLCISPHPDQRPRMSKVLKILEGDVLTDIACDYRQRLSVSLSQNVNSIQQTDQRRVIGKLEYYIPSFDLMQTICNTNINPSGPSMHRESEENTEQQKLLSSGWGLNQPELDVSEEYQAYLHSSLAKFVQNLKEK